MRTVCSPSKSLLGGHRCPSSRSSRARSSCQRVDELQLDGVGHDRVSDLRDLLEVAGQIDRRGRHVRQRRGERSLSSRRRRPPRDSVSGRDSRSRGGRHGRSDRTIGEAPAGAGGMAPTRRRGGGHRRTLGRWCGVRRGATAAPPTHVSDCTGSASPARRWVSLLYIRALFRCDSGPDSEFGIRHFDPDAVRGSYRGPSTAPPRAAGSGWHRRSCCSSGATRTRVEAPSGPATCTRGPATTRSSRRSSGRTSTSTTQARRTRTSSKPHTTTCSIGHRTPVRPTSGSTGWPRDQLERVSRRRSTAAHNGAASSPTRGATATSFIVRRRSPTGISGRTSRRRGSINSTSPPAFTASHEAIAKANTPGF